MNEKHIIVFSRIFGQYFCETDIWWIELNLILRDIMIQLVIIKGLYERTHLIKNPNLFLKCNSVNIISKTDIVKYFNIEINGNGGIDMF